MFTKLTQCMAVDGVKEIRCIVSYTTVILLRIQWHIHGWHWSPSTACHRCHIW